MDQKLRVVLGTHYPFDAMRIRGGIEAVAHYLTQALSKKNDIELHVVSCNRSINRSFTEVRGTVIFHWLKTGKRLYDLRAATINAWQVRRVYHQVHPDLIHAQGMCEYSLAATINIPMLLSIHGLEWFVPQMQKTNHYQGLVGKYRKTLGSWIANISIKNASGVVSNSGEYALNLLNGLLDHKAIYFIGNPIAEDFFALPLKGVSSTTKRMILWAGVISERKDILGLVEAFSLVYKRFPNVHLVLTGGVADQFYYQKVRSLIQKLNLAENVVMKGFIRQEELISLYKECSMVVLSSLEETAPMVLAQAMAAGKAVVSTNVGGISWMVDDGKTGFLSNVGDVQGMANQIIKLLEDDDKRKGMGNAARERALKLFEPNSVAENTIKAYRELLRV